MSDGTMRLIHLHPDDNVAIASTDLAANENGRSAEAK